MDKKLFGTRINKARKDRGLTAEKLAEACNINSTYLRQIEGGKKLPSLPVFATLCRELRVSPNYILPDLVEGTEAEKIQKIFSESDPTPSQIEMLAEMAGVIMKERYPDIGAPNWEIIVAAAAEQIAGAGLILWTCREGELLENALEACARWGLHFDAVNDSLPSWKKFYGNDTRKVGATEYWDDKAYRVQNGKLMKEVAHEMD